MIRPWPTIDSKELGNFRIFSIREDRKRSPRTDREHDFIVMNCRNWVNVVAVTEDDQIVMVEQYRHGTNTVELEIPGGVMDATDTSPVEAGLRELREETGYAGEDARLIGEVFSNPAIMNNRTYTVLVRDCREVHETEFDHGEDLVTRLIPIDEVHRLVAAGEIRHSLVVAALYHFSQLP